ncbi:MAG: D-tyrosyl-tRNA(Tyr) deacylase [Actinomycetaceae bacterium]|nr:D-tyrosyl-tRNA(Tyr) deacylase [Actinomycetaceae bacterium]
MRAVVQRVKRASVTVYSDDDGTRDAHVVAEIGPGLAVLVGVTHEDGKAQIDKVARKIAQLKLLRSLDNSDDPASRISAIDAGAPVLLVSQFTLYADVRKGTKPSWSKAAPGHVAEPIFDQLVQAVRGYGLEVQTGSFGAMMDVELVNDGPFTILIEA